ncbi:MAG: 30S ribosomal protein S21 [Patescibacteria group bacterium]|nr:30S ribosomal protein S21 [Patescibacteria group bacterium]
MNKVVEVKVKTNESFEKLVRRFTKKIIQSGKLIQARKIRFKTKVKNARKRKAGAIHRVKAQDKREYLRKIGKLDEPTM